MLHEHYCVLQMPSYWQWNFDTAWKQICPDMQASIACVPVLDLFRSCDLMTFVYELDPYCLEIHQICKCELPT